MSDQTASEERVNVDRCWWGTTALRGRILAASLALMAVGCAVLGLASRSGHPATAHAAGLPAGVSNSLPESFLGGNLDLPARPAQLKASSLYSGLPLRFEPNQGQGKLDPADRRAKFVARGSGYGLFLGAEGAILTLVSPDRSIPQSTQVQTIEMRLVGGDPSAELTAEERLPGKSNYLIGNDSSRWRVGVPQFARVRYQSVYPGIDLVFYGNQGQLEYDFQIAPGADPATAELEFRGAQQLEVRNDALVIRTGERSVKLQAPTVYQEMAGEKRAVDGKFVLRGGNRVGFAVGPYDRSRALVIDPILNFSSYFGGNRNELATSIAVDGSFNIYLAGSTTSTDLPATGTTITGAGPNVYIAKITPPLGSIVATLDYVTYLGGSGQDTPVGIKVDGANQPYVAGTTSSSDFPTSPTAYQTVPAPAGAGKQHVFVTKLTSDATSLLYSSYLSGNGTDLASGMTINAGGFVFITGTTTSLESSSSDQFPASNLPNSLPYQPASHAAAGQPQFFVTKVDPSARGDASVPYSTYFGGGTVATGAPIAIGGGIAVDTSNNVYFTGTTNYLYAGCSGCRSTDFPIQNAYQPCLDTAPPTSVLNPPACSSTSTATESDAFVAKLNSNDKVPPGSQLVWSTYLGGTATDSSTGVALDSGAANVYVVGTTNSPDIASSVTSLAGSASFQRCLDTPVNPTGGASCTAPPTPAPNDAFVARLSNPASSTTASTTNVVLSYFSYLGGSGADQGTAIVVDNGSGALVAGWTDSSDFPVVPLTNPIQNASGGGRDAFVARLYTLAVTGQTTTASWSAYFGGTGTDEATGIALDVNQNTYLAGVSDSAPPTLRTAKPLADTQGGGYKGGTDAFVTQLGTAVNLSVQGQLTQGTNQQGFISAGNQATFTYTIQNSGPDLANNITVIDNISSAVTGVPVTFNSASVSSGTCGGVSTNSIVSCSLPQLQAGSTATVTIVLTPNGTSGTQQAFNGGPVQVIAPGNIVLAQTSVGAKMSDFRMFVSPTNQSLAAAGDTAQYTVQLTPDPLYASSITVSCSNLPTGSSCRLTPSSLTLQNAGGSTAALAITTTARPVTTGAMSFLKRSFYALWLTVPGFLLVGLGGDRRRRRMAAILTLCSISAVLFLIPACSHSTTQTPVSGTPAGSYTITVTAASGSDSKTQTVGLNVP